MLVREIIFRYLIPFLSVVVIIVVVVKVHEVIWGTSRFRDIPRWIDGPWAVEHFD